MKKFFASLLALVGMVAGLALTSCGGGGGGGNLSGKSIVASGTIAAYSISIGEKVAGSLGLGSYACTIEDYASTAQSSIVITVDKLEWGEQEEDGKNVIKMMEATVVPGSMTPEENAAFYKIITGIVSTNNAITQLYFDGPMKMTVEGTKLTWKGRVSYSAIADNVTQEVDREINLEAPLIAIQ
ncbi:MAG: hypothetical protein IJN23_00005 [Akkermansia sp.]|nr:hypothetical protein [Akkermansia sp.]